MGLGMGFVMAPMSTAAMNSVSADKAGAASGILSMSRMVGGTFGVAALGALFQHLSSERLADSLASAPVSAGQREQLVENLGSGGGEVVRGLDPATAEQVSAAVRDAFVHALSSGMWMATGFALFGALVAALMVRDRSAAAKPETDAEPETPAEAHAAGEARPVGV